MHREVAASAASALAISSATSACNLRLDLARVRYKTEAALCRLAWRGFFVPSSPIVPISARPSRAPAQNLNENSHSIS